LLDVTAVSSKTPETPLIFVAYGTEEHNAYVTDPADGRPLICVDMELASGFSDLLKKTLTEGTVDKHLSAKRYVFSLTWGLRWLLFHELAHLGFGHFIERPGSELSEVTSSRRRIPAPFSKELLEERCQEAEADLWATHMMLRDVACQFYQILVDDETSLGRPFSDHLFSTLITLFSYLNREALAHNAYAKRVHAHPSVRMSLVYWYAGKKCESMEFFVVDWRHLRVQYEIMSDVFQFNKLPNLMLSKQDQKTDNVQRDLDLTLARLRERQAIRDSSRSLFRLEL